jgi:flagellar hook protein FlgE
MTRSFYNGITGVRSFQTSIDIWGDNISNINTIGFKEKTPDFDTLFSQTLTGSISDDVGLGTTITSAALDIKQGSILETQNPFDLALSDEGWFAISKNNQTFYTRNGTFTKDAQGYLVNNGGYLLVSSANNLTKTPNGTYIVDPTKKPDILNSQLNKINLPENIIYPNFPTSTIKLDGLIYDSDTLQNSSLSTSDLSLSALYDDSSNFLNVKENQNLLVGFGNKSVFENGKIKTTYCISGDKADGKDLNITLEINGKTINITIPDGSSANKSAKIISKELTNNGIENSLNNNELTIYSPRELIIKSNVDFIPNSASKILYYSSNAKENSFDTLNDFINQTNSIASNIYSNVNVSFKDGKIILTNNSNENITSFFEPADKSNEKFLKELATLNNTLIPEKSLSSHQFFANSQDYSSKIISKDGENKIVFNFTKSKVLDESTIFKTTINIYDKNDNLISSNTSNITFDKNGKLITPTTLTLTKPQNITITLNLLKNSVTKSFNYQQDGIKGGNLTNYQIDSQGNILAMFDNGRSATLAQIPIFHFQNDRGLDNIGENLYTPTINSNKAILYSYNGIYIPGAQIISGAVENSNVQMTTAMTELIVNQKAFSANAKTVTTSDEMIKRAIELKR